MDAACIDSGYFDPPDPSHAGPAAATTPMGAHAAADPRLRGSRGAGSVSY